MKPGEYQKNFFTSLTKYATNNVHYNKTYSVITIRQYISSLTTRHKILDVGCADGELLASFVNKHEIYGVDNAVSLLKIAKNKRIKTKTCDIEEQIPYPKDYFDLLIIHHVIEHLVNTDKFLSECNRVLKRNGTIFLTFPNTASLISMVFILFDRPPYFGAGYRTVHVRDFTLRTIKTAFENNGFIIIKKLGGQFLPFLEYGYWLSSRISRFFPQFAYDKSLIIKKNRDVKSNQKSSYNLGILGFNKIISKIIIK